MTAYGELDIETEYGYDPLGRLSAITNPIEEAYSYQYNPIDRPYSIKIPGVTGLKETWWDKAYRPIATRDAEGNTLLYRYDIYNRLTHVYTASAGASLGNSSEMKPENAFSSFEDELLLENTYALDHTWLQMSTERILTSNGFGGNKVTDNTDQGNGTIDDLGRPEKIRVSYPDGVMISMPTYTDAMLVPYTQTNITGPDNQAIDLEYTFGFDDLLRPENTYLNVNSSGSQLISELVYNEVDQVKIKYLGDYLQEINYLYDKTGRLTHINSRGQMECFEDLTICALEFEKSYDISQAGEPLCSYLEAIQVDGQVYTFPDILYLTPSGLSDLYDVDEELENYIQEGLDYFGLMGEVTVEQNVVEGQQVDYTIFIQNTNTDQVSLHFTSTSCTQIVAFTVVSCCEVEGQSGGGGSSNTLVESPDLYFQENTFSGLDISRIEIGSDCITGFMANDYTYDANHRLTQMDNTLYNPSPQTGSYSTQYTYDDAGNILTLKRRGLVPPLSSPPVYGAIDELTYSYNDPLNPQEKSRVQSIIDAVTDPNAQPEGFKGNQNPGDAIPDKASTFEYDKNGNLIYDGGKELTIDYNLLNLPRLVSHSGSGNSIQLDYAFGGEKIRKISPEGTRIYLGGVEYLDNSPESLTHSDGRVDLSGAGGPKHQFSIKDHLGNTAVLFEDANNDGAVFSSEVLQRNLYYPFGLELKGEWNSATSPRMDYLYNGKEFNEELELNWLDYGFRWYDPAVGRFPSGDPLAEQRSWVSPYNYVQNNPVLRVDPNGALDSPIFGLDGKFLGTDSEGFEGEIIIMNEGQYNFLSNYGEDVIDHGSAMGLAKNGFGSTLNDYVIAIDPKNEASTDLIGKIFTNLIDAAYNEGYIEINSSHLVGGKIDIDNDTDYAGGGAATSTRIGEKHRISALLKSVSLDQYRNKVKSGNTNQFWYLGNSGDAINILGVHEPLHKDYPSRGGGSRGHGGMNREILRNPKYRKVMSIASDAYRTKVKEWANGN